MHVYIYIYICIYTYIYISICISEPGDARGGAVDGGAVEFESGVSPLDRQPLTRSLGTAAATGPPPSLGGKRHIYMKRDLYK